MARLSNRSTLEQPEHPQPEVVRMLWSRYADTMYDLALRLVYDRDVALDIVRRAFDGLASPTRSADVSLRAWLLARTRRLALDQLQVRTDLRTARQRNLSRPPWTEAVDRGRLQDEQTRETVQALASDLWIAAASLSPADFSLLDLYVRKDLSKATIAAATGQPETTVSVVLERTQTDLRRATADQLLLRFGPAECPSLKVEVGRRPTSILSAELRARISGHVRACGRCRRNWQEFAGATAFYPALATVSLPAEIRESMTGLQTPAPVQLASSAAPFTLPTAPPYRSPPHRLLRRILSTPASLVIPVAVLALVVGAWLAFSDRLDRTEPAIIAEHTPAAFSPAPASVLTTIPASEAGEQATAESQPTPTPAASPPSAPASVGQAQTTGSAGTTGQGGTSAPREVAAPPAAPPLTVSPAATGSVSTAPSTAATPIPSTTLITTVPLPSPAPVSPPTVAASPPVLPPSPPPAVAGTPRSEPMPAPTPAQPALIPGQVIITAPPTVQPANRTLLFPLR